MVRTDLANPAAAAAAVDQVADALGRLDICVCNAGAIHRQPSLEVPLETWAHVVTVNLISTFAMARSAARLGTSRMISTPLDRFLPHRCHRLAHALSISW